MTATLWNAQAIGSAPNKRVKRRREWAALKNNTPKALSGRPTLTPAGASEEAEVDPADAGEETGATGPTRSEGSGAEVEQRGGQCVASRPRDRG